MEIGGEWTASALFSPSKARAQQAQAKDWAFIDAWLAKRYGSKRLPVYERNQDTLQTLLALATYNDTADEQQTLAERTQRSVLQTVVKRHTNEDRTLQRALLQTISEAGERTVDALSELALVLHSNDIVTMAKTLREITIEHFQLRERNKRAQTLQTMLDGELARVGNVLKDIKSDVLATPPAWPKQTYEWTRTAKHLKTKVAEYDERLSGLQPAYAPSVSVEQTARRLTDLESHRIALSELEMELDGFQSLPSDGKAAKPKLETVRDRLRKLTAERDNIFEHLVDPDEASSTL